MLNRHEKRRAFRLITGRSDENETRAFLCKVLFCFPSDIAKGVCEEAPNRDAATFDPEAMKTMEARIVPYIEPEDIGGPSEEVGL